MKELRMAITPCRPKWKGTMTDRERFNNQMHYKPIDRCFNFEFGYWNENFTEWDIFVNNGIKSNEEADVFFNFDRMDGAAGCTGMHPGFEYKVISETETTKIIQNSRGLLAEIPKDGHDTIPHFLKSSITTPDDWKRVKAEHFDPQHPDRKVDIAALKKRLPPDRDVPASV